VRLRPTRFAARLLALWLISASLAWAELGRPIVRVFGPRDTGGGDAIWTVTQDERGLLYCGSDSVLTFDGERWQQHRIPGSYAVRALALTPERLWAGAVNEIGFFPRDPSGRLGEYHSLVDQLPAEQRNLDDVWHVFPSAGGATFVTADRVIVWDGTHARIHSLAGPRRLPSMQLGGKIYLSHLPTGLWTLTPRGLEPFSTGPEMADLGTLRLDETAHGLLLVTARGLFHLADHRLSPFAPEASAFIRENIPTSAVRLPQGDLAIGTLNGGVALVSPNGDLKRILSATDGLPPSIYSLFADRDGALWVGSATALARVSVDPSVTLYDSANGLAGRVAHAFAEHDGRLHVATASGVFSLPLGSDASAHFSPVPEMPLRYYDILGAPEGIYLARYKALERFHRSGTELAFATDRDALLIRRSRAQPGTYFIVENPDLVRLHPAPDGLLQRAWSLRLPDAPVEFAEDRKGHIWAATRSRGVFHISPDLHATPISFNSPAPLTFRPTLVGELDGRIVVCAGGRLLVGAGENFTPIANAPAGDPLAITEPDPTGRLWIAFASPFADGERIPVIGHLSLPPDQPPRWQSVAVPGLASIGGLTRLFVDSRGIVWAGGTEGLLRLDPAQLHPVAAPHPPTVAARFAPGAQLPYHGDPITLTFATHEFGRRESLRFQTKLSTSADWSAPSPDAHLTLAGLRDGHYTFSVRVLDDAGLTSPAASLRFTVLPPWYRTPAALAGWTALAVASFLAGIQWRSAYLRRRNTQLEQLVRRKTEQLEKANAAKSDFLANMSHEIRNPISGILGLSLALEETALDARQRKVAASIQSCAKLLSTLVDDVLDFSKIEAGQIDLRPAPFSLQEALDNCVAIVTEDARAAGSTLSLDLAPDLPPRVVGDMPRVQQIVLNFLTNAVKFGAGQPIVIGASRAGADRVRLFVRDRGPGLADSEIASLFTKFSRLPQAHAANIRGSGLGLAVCRLLARKMGGDVGVDSQPGAGSCFWTEIPLPPAPGDLSAPARSVTVPARHPLRALIVEDIDYNAEAMQAVLRRIGIESEVASDGPTALEKLRSSFYDVVFMDWNLPGMIGTEVVSRYRAEEPPDRRTIIIATTAYSADVNREACLAAGMDAFIAKPFTPEKIATALAELRGSFRAAVSVEIGAPPPQPRNPPAAAAFDLQMLHFLAADDTGGLPTQIARYLAAFESDVDALRDALHRQDPTEIHRRAHRCVSHASMVKHDPLAHLARDLQSHAASPSPAEREKRFAAFEREFLAFKETLARSSASSAPA
jgi:Signal transduction histidine kinase